MGRVGTSNSIFQPAWKCIELAVHFREADSDLAFDGNGRFAEIFQGNLDGFLDRA